MNADRSDDRVTFAELTARSKRVANYLRGLGIGRGDRILLVLGNCVPLWETMLAAMKIGAVLIPAAKQLTPDDLRDRIDRGAVKAVVAASGVAPRSEGLPGAATRIAVGQSAPGWHAYVDADKFLAEFEPRGITRASDPLVLYFTSGTTARPKLVEHTHAS